MDITTVCSVCLACAVLVMLFDLLAAAVRDRGAHLSDALWGIALIAVQAVALGFAKSGLIDAEQGALGLAGAGVLGAVCIVCVHLVCVRRRAARALITAAGPSDGVAMRVIALPAAIVLLCCAAVLCVLALELPHSYDFSVLDPKSVYIEWALLAAALVGLYFLAQRRGFLAALVPVASAGFGLAEYFVYLFKGQPLQPGDLLAAGTAATVASGYTYTLSGYCLLALAAAVAAITICVYLTPLHYERVLFDGQAPARERGARAAGIVANFAAAACVLGGLWANVTGVDYAAEYGIQVNAWAFQVSYSTQAYLPTFISACQGMVPTEPEGYSVEGAQELLADYAGRYDASELGGASWQRAEASGQFDAEKPAVVCVMNETFSDLSIFDGMHAGYEGPAYFKSIGDCLVRGTLYMSVNGGGTTNSEFEFLTGNSMGNLGGSVYPYNVYDLSGVENLAGQFKELGYDTLAMHPYHPSNWNRTNVYEDMGFDEFLSLEDFAGADTLRGFVRDRSTYDVILQRLAEDPDPQFVFDVTMQNHSGYDSGAIPEELMVRLGFDGGEGDPLIDEYVSLIQQSDADLQYFLEQLSQMDRKVVVVFFGDHQPYMTGGYNDLWFDDADEAVHQERLYQTSYIIWANYDVAGNDQVSEVRDLAASSLGSMLMQQIGAPLSDYQKAHVELWQALPIQNVVGYLDPQGTWHLSGEDSGLEETDEARADSRTLQYYTMFGDGKGIYATKLQTEANL